MGDIVTLVYPGLSKQEVKAAMRLSTLSEDEFPFPKRPGQGFFYHVIKKDDDVTRKRKAARRKDYMQTRIAECKAHVVDLDAIRSVCGLVFEKDLPLVVDLEDLSSGQCNKLLGKDWAPGKPGGGLVGLGVFKMLSKKESAQLEAEAATAAKAEALAADKKSAPSKK